MRIGIDGACLSNRRGFGRFARQVVAALARSGSTHDFSVFVDRPSLGRGEVPDRFTTVPVEVKEAPSRAASASGRRSIGDMLSMSWAISRERLDLVYFPASYSFVPVWGVKRVVVTMHDTLALAHPELVFPDGKGRLAWKAKEHAAVGWADRIVTVSESARRDLIDWFRLADERVCVVSEGPDPVFRPRHEVEGMEVLRRYGIDPDRRYWLYVGGLSPHKNLLRLIEAFARLDPGERLVLVGDLRDVFHTHVPELRAAVDRLGLVERIRFTGFVPDDALSHLYSRAYALVQPSLMEGFGLPPVEAMACGTPVASSRAGSLPEVVGDAGVLFDPTDVAAIAETMRSLGDDPVRRDSLAKLALERATRFTWDAAARSLLACLDGLDPTRHRTQTAPRKTA
jgi:glycosyltransferase involved in cell wall biosynthesis